jgi:transcriptional regulator with XRE-family HTH domain
MLEKIKKYRLSNNFSQQKVADLIGVPRSRYQKWEDGISKKFWKYEILS